MLKALAAPGEHALVFTLVAGQDSDLLDGTLVSVGGAAPRPPATTATRMTTAGTTTNWSARPGSARCRGPGTDRRHRLVAAARATPGQLQGGAVMTARHSAGRSCSGWCSRPWRSCSRACSGCHPSHCRTWRAWPQRRTPRRTRRGRSTPRAWRACPTAASTCPRWRSGAWPSARCWRRSPRPPPRWRCRAGWSWTRTPAAACRPCTAGASSPGRRACRWPARR